MATDYPSGATASHEDKGRRDPRIQKEGEAPSTFEDGRMELPGHTALLLAAETKFGTLDQELRSMILELRESDHLESLLGDLKLTQTVEHLKRAVSYFSGKEYGYIEGLRAAVEIVLGIDDDESAEQISERAFQSHDAEELERLLLLAASPLRHSAPSSN